MDNLIAINNVEFDQDNYMRIIRTDEGTFDKKRLFNTCLNVLNKNVILNFNISTLLQMYLYFDCYPLEDSFEDPLTGRVFFPVRIVILKSLILSPHHISVQWFLQTSDHYVAKIRRAALKGGPTHQVTAITSPEPASCACREPVTSTNVLVCDRCDIVFCNTCAHHLCPAFLQECINAQELKDASPRSMEFSFSEEDETSDEDEDADLSESDGEQESVWYMESEEEIEMEEDDSDEEMEIDVVGL